jgi:predicted peptidase
VEDLVMKSWIIILSVTVALATGIDCTGEKKTDMEEYPYTKIPPESWRKLEAVRDSYKPMPDLEAIYRRHQHENDLPYHVYIPDSLSAGEAYPLVVFLHGHTDLDLNVHGGIPKGVWTLPSVQRRHPHIVFVPRHRTEDDDWTRADYRNMVVEALDDLIGELNGDPNSPSVDTNRVYLTGFSQGGMGTWDYIRQYPDRFAAASPLSGFYHGPQNESDARAIAHIPIWIFNGSGDDGVNGSRTSFRTLKAAGAADVRYHEFVDHGHVIDDIAYFTEGFMDWMFAQKRKE